MVLHDDLTIRIVPRGRESGRPYTEMLYRWTEDGETRYALTRVPWIVRDTPHDAARERQEFIRRRRES